MRKYQYIIYYDLREEYSPVTSLRYKDSYGTDSFLAFLFKFISLKRKYGVIEMEYNKAVGS